MIYIAEDRDWSLQTEMRSANVHRKRSCCIATAFSLVVFDCCLLLPIAVIWSRRRSVRFVCSHSLSLLLLLLLLLLLYSGIRAFGMSGTNGQMRHAGVAQPTDFGDGGLHFVCFLDHGVSRWKRTYQSLSLTFIYPLLSLSGISVFLTGSCLFRGQSFLKARTMQ